MASGDGFSGLKRRRWTGGGRRKERSKAKTHRFDLAPPGGALRASTALARGLHVETFEPRVLLSADLVPIVDRIDLPGETDRFIFDISERRQLLFDALTPENRLTWMLEGPGGVIVPATRFTQSDGADGGSVIALDAGTYTLSVDGEGDFTGDYQFRILNLENAPAAPVGTQVSGVLENQGRETDLFRFSFEAGTELYFDAEAISNGSATWELVGPDGSTVFGPTTFASWSDITRFAVPQTGIYTLLLEGRVYNGSGTVPYAFTVHRVVDRVQAIAPDTAVIERIESPGQRNIHTFSMATAGRLIFDSLRPSSGLVWSLSGPLGTLVNKRQLAYSDGSFANPILDLAAGDYVLTVEGSGDARGGYGFRLLSEASDIRLDPGVEEAFRLGDAGATAPDLVPVSTAPTAGGPTDRMLQSDANLRMTVADSAALNPAAFTAEAWLRPDTLAPWTHVMGKSAPWLSGGWGLYINGEGNLVFFVDAAFDAAKQVTAALPAGAWTHVAASYDGATLRLYLGGTLAASLDYDGGFAPVADPFLIGSTGWYSGWRGQMDEVRLWDRALPAADIAARMNQRLAGAATGLVASWGFDGAPSRTVADRSGNGHDGRLNEAPGTETRILRFAGTEGQSVTLSATRGGSAQFRLIAPSGEVIRGPAALATAEGIVLPQTGDYRLVVEGYMFDGPADVSVLVMPETTRTLSLNPGERIDGTIGTVGETVVYGFTLAAPANLHFDALTSDRGDITWRLVGPRGAEAGPIRFDQSDGWNYTYYHGTESILRALPAGDYSLVIDGTGAATGDFAFRLFAIPEGALIAYDTPVNLTLDPATESRAFRLNGAAGDRIGFEVAAGWPFGRLIDPFGRTLMVGDFGYLADYTLESTGTYTILIEGHPGSIAGTPAEHTFSVALIDQSPPGALTGTAITLGTTVAGSIEAEGEEDAFRLTLPTARRLVFDGIADPDYAIAWTMTGPRGTEVPLRGIRDADGPNGSTVRVLDLPAGTYQIRVSRPDGQAGGDYAFRLLDIGVSTAITLGETVATTLDPATGSQVFRFDGTAGDALVMTSAPGQPYFWWTYGPFFRVVDPFGRQVIDSRATTEGASFTLPSTGTYTLILEGSNYADPEGAFEMSFVLERVQHRVLPLTIGADVTGQIASPRGSDRYEFDLAAPAVLVLDTLSYATAVAATLTGPAGTPLRSFTLGTADSAETGTPPVFLLPAGRHALTLRHAWSTTARPAYAFRLIDAAAAPEIVAGTPVAGTLDPSHRTQVFRFQGTAGQSLGLGDVTNTGSTYGAYLRVVDPAGRAVVGPRSLGPGDPIPIDVDGTYLVLIEGRAFENPANVTTFGFTLLDPQSPAPRAVATDTPITGAIDRPGQRHVLTLTLDGDGLLAFDSLLPDSAVQVRITGPGGLNRTVNLRSADGFDASVGPVIRTYAGTYTLEVRRTDGGTGNYAFALRDLGAGRAIALDERVEGRLAPARETDVFRFEGTAGDAFLMDVLRMQGAGWTPAWRLIDPRGNVELGPVSFADREPHRLLRTGTYTLLLEGRVFEGAAVEIDYAFRLQKARQQVFDAAFPGSGHPAGLSPEAGPGAGAALGFTGLEYIEIDDPATNRTGDVSFDLWFRPDQPTATWQSLVYSGGSSVGGRQYTLWLNAAGYLHLTSADASGQINVDSPAGSVAFGDWNHVVGVVDRTGQALRLYLNGVLAGTTALRDQPSVAAAQPLRLGAAVEGHGAYRGAMAGFRLFGAALGDDDAAALRAGDPVAAAPVVHLPMDEADGGPVLADAGADGRDGVVRDFAAGLAGAFIGRLERPGEVDVHRFTLDAPRLLFWDVLTDEGSVTAALRGPGGVAMTRTLNATGAPGNSGNQAFLAPAGDYTLTFSGQSTFAGPYGLRLVDLSAAPVLALDAEPVAVTLPAQRAAAAFALDIAAGERVFVDIERLSVGAGSAAFRLIDSYGRQIHGPVSASDFRLPEVASSGRYWLVLEGSRSLGPQAALSFTLAARRVDTAPVAVAPEGANPGAGPVAVPGALGQGLALRGAEHVEIAHDPALTLNGNVTLEAWVRPESFTNTYSTLFHKVSGGGGTDATFEVHVVSNGAIWAGTRRPDGGWTSAQTTGGRVALGEWTHVAVVFDRTAGELRIYANGALALSQAMPVTLAASNDGPIAIGRYMAESGSVQMFDGAIDEVRLWSVARSGDEIAADYNRTLTGTETGLRVWLPFESLAGDTTPNAGPTATAVRIANLNPTGITGTIEGVGQERLYTFTLDSARLLYLDSLSNRSDIIWRLEGPQGLVAERRLSQSDANSLGTSPVMALPAGEYRLRLRGDGDATGNFNLVLRDLSAAATAAKGAPVDGVVEPGNATAVIAFDAAAGDRVFLDHIEGTGGLRWRLIDPFGQQTLGSVTAGDRRVGPLLADGRHYLLIEGMVPRGGREAFRVAVHDRVETAAEPLTFNTRHTAVLPTPGAAARFGFSLAADTLVTMDSLHSLADLVWTLEGPGGTRVSSRAFSATDANQLGGNPVLRLGAGDYVLTVEATGDRTGSYDFRLIDLAAAAIPIVVNDEVLGNLPEGGIGTAVFRLTAEQFQAISMAVTAFPANNTAWRLVAADGGTISGGRQLRSSGPYVLPAAGDYFVLVEGSLSDGPTANPYRFTLTSRTVPTGAGDTRETFGDGSGIGHVAGAFAGPDPAVEDDGSGNLVMRMLDPLRPGQRTGLVFSHTEEGRFDRIDFGFDFRMTPPASGAAGNGVAAAWLPTARYGRNADVAFFAQEPNLTGALGVAIDLVQDSGDGSAGVPHLSLHFGSRLLEVPLASAGLGLADLMNAAGRLDVTAVRASGGARVTVVLTLDGTARTLVDAQFVGGFDPAEGRLAIQASNGTAAVMGLTVDEVTIAATPAAAPPELTLGTLVSGALNDPQAVDRHRFVLSAPTLIMVDSQTANGNFQWSLTMPGGTEGVGATRFDQTDSGDRWWDPNTLYRLPAGTWDLNVFSPNGSVGSYAIRLLDAATATPVALDTAIEGTLDPANRTDLLAFDLPGGTGLYLQTEATGGTAPYLRLFDPLGNAIWGPQQAGNDLRLDGPLPAGRYILAVEGRIGASGTASWRILANDVAPVPAAMTLDSAVTGTLALPGDRAVHTLTLAGPKLVHFDSLTPNTALRWQLDGPMGTVAGGNIAQADADSRGDSTVIALPPGTWRVSVWGNGRATGDYGFVLRDLASAETLEPGTVVEAVHEPGNTTRLYTFEGRAGDRYFLDHLGGTLAGRWRIVDRFGQLVGAGNRSAQSDWSGIALAIDGAHTLIVEGRIGDGDGPRTHSFRLVPVTDTVVPLTLGERTTGALTAPGQLVRHSFTLAAPTLVYIDAQDPANGNFRWSLTGPRGGEGSRRFTNSDSRDASEPAVLALPAGDYLLTVDAAGDVTGPYGIAVLDLAEAAPITLGTQVSGQLAPGSETIAYRFDGTAGERFFFDARNPADFQSGWRLIDPFGRAVFTNWLHEDVDAVTLTETGTYTLLIEGRIWYPETRDYAFNVYANPVVAPIRLYALEVTPAPDLVPAFFELASAAPIYSGGTLPVRWEVENAGDVALTEDFASRVTVRRADTGAILADVLVPYSVAAAGQIAPGARAAQSLTLQLPPGSVAVGDLVVTLRLDANNAIAEQNAAGTAEQNNTAELAVTAALAPYADLTAADVALSPAGGWAAGQTVTATWTSRNDGTAEVTGPFSERLVITNRNTGRVVFSQDIRDTNGAGFGPGDTRSRTVSFGWPAGAAGIGLFDIAVVADVLGEVFETNPSDTGESNNTARIAIASAPDLTVTAVSLAEAEPASGGLVTVRWTLENRGAAETRAGWTDRVRITRISTGTVVHDVTVASDGAIPAGGSAGRSVQLRLPDGLAGTGDFRITVDADSANALPEARAGLTVAEAEGNNSATATFTATLRPYPNLVAAITGTPVSPRGGETARIEWRVTNAGAAATDAAAWVDRIWLSRDGTLDAADTLLATVPRTGALAAGGAYAVAADIALPLGFEGDVWFFVEADAARAVTEPDTRADNIAAASVTMASPAADLRVQAVGAPTGAFVGRDTIRVTWRVENAGPDAIPAGAAWMDNVWLSPTPTLGAGAVLLGSVGRSGALGVGATYARAADLMLPAGLAGIFHVVVETNADSGVFERGATANNTRASAGTIAVAEAPSPDLVVTTVTGPASLVPGQTADVTFTVRNTGETAARAPWTDTIRIAGPGTPAGGIALLSVPRTFDLAPGAEYTVTATVTVPELGLGDFRFEVRTDANAQVYEGGREANNLRASADATMRHPNLTVAALTLPAGPFTSGDTIRVAWTVENAGGGPAPRGWTDRIWLSRTAVPGPDAILLHEAATAAAVPFAAGARIDAAADVALPIDVSGGWFVVVETDARNSVIEPGAEGDNLRAAPIDVALAPYANLVVTALTAPALTVNDPATVTIGWTVENQGTGRGITDTWVDRIFVSTNDIAGDADDIEIARFTHEGGLALGDSYSRSEQVMLPPGFNGRFRLFVMTDAGRTVFENGLEADNTRVLSGVFDVAPIPYADLVVKRVEAPAAAQSGTSVLLRWEVANEGIG